MRENTCGRDREELAKRSWHCGWRQRSYNLLDEDEKHRLARLAVFRGGCSLEAIEGICGEGLSIDVLDGLASLVDKHLVQQKEMPGGEPHFVMLEMIQEYARERLKTSGDALHGLVTCSQ